jgi:ATPase family associated with various cellular activities (AAA)
VVALRAVAAVSSLTMQATANPDWLNSNQQSLLDGLARIRSLLERQISKDSGRPGISAEPAAPVAEPWSALDYVAEVFGLTRFERDLLTLCVAVELDSDFEVLCEAAGGKAKCARPTFSLALAAFPEAHWSAISPDRPLRHWGLIEIDRAAGIASAPLRIDERVLNFIVGVAHGDPRLAGIAEPIRWSVELAASHEEIARQTASVWSKTDSKSPPVVQLCGFEQGMKRAIACHAAELLGCSLLLVPARGLPAAPAELERVIRLIERECFLLPGAVLLECDGAEREDSEREHVIARFLDTTRASLAISSLRRRPAMLRPLVSLDVDKPSIAEQRAVWTSALDGDSSFVGDLTAQFSLHAHDIRNIRACAEVEAAAAGDPDRLHDAIWNGCRTLARPKMEDLAQRISATAAWEDLVLAEPQRSVLREMALHIRHRATVYQRWGFGQENARGLGVSALFVGASGTGKTMAAEILARDLRLDLYRIDLSSTISKYIGETEKNLRRVFDAAEESGSILLFDEADALFGKRSEVRDSHDRYANIEVSYLLQRVESFRGLAILTSNLPEALDAAFLRRIRFIVHFPFPDAVQRAEIWRRIFPPETPTEGLNWAKLASLNVAGGNIRNIALQAAFAAAEANLPVRFPHLLRAARAEYRKLERPLPESEIQGWA